MAYKKPPHYVSQVRRARAHLARAETTAGTRGQASAKAKLADALTHAAEQYMSIQELEQAIELSQEALEYCASNSPTALRASAVIAATGG